MKYIMVLIWSILLLEMVGFVLTSLDGGSSVNWILPIIVAVVFTIFVVIFTAIIKPTHKSYQEEQ
ncbi:YjzD family protein [Staphylococcus pettenkoferi]